MKCRAFLGASTGSSIDRRPSRSFHETASLVRRDARKNHDGELCESDCASGVARNIFGSMDSSELP